MCSLAVSYPLLCLVELRAIYDKYGEYGLKEGVIVAGERIGGGYFMKTSPEAIFDRIFNSVNPWEDQSNLDGTDFRGSMFGDGFNGQNAKKAPAPMDVVVTLDCSLQEFYVGSIKQFEYQVYEVQHDGKTVTKVMKQKTIQVDPGFGVDTVLTFPGLGNQAPKQKSADLLVRFTQTENQMYRRSGDDLILTVKVSLLDALEFKPI
jgi:DnaJ-class molecular chaperone